MERALLRDGNVHSADDWQSVLEPIVGRYRDFNIARFFRGDAAFANPNVYRYLEAERYFYAIRLIGNPILHNKIEHLLTRKRNFLTAKGEYGEIIDVVRRKLCLLSV
jgi:hypothetical protein